LNANGHLVNEGIVASLALLQELSAELSAEGQALHRLRAPWGSYVGFAPAVAGLEFIGVRLLGMVQLKGLDNIDIGEIVPFAPGEAEAATLDTTEPLMSILRQEFHHQRQSEEPPNVAADTTHERELENEIVIC